MLRITNGLKILNITKEVVNTDSYVINSQTVRWRKPRWIPQAKSKIFKVPPKTVIPEDEKIELMRLTNNYKTQIKSIRRYLHGKYYRLGTFDTNVEEQRKQFEEDFASCVEINNKWNDEQRVVREKRVAEELEEALNVARDRLELELKKREEKQQLIEEIVRKEKEESKNYITPENIDAAIERALATTVDYNFAINLDGEEIKDFEHEKKTEQKATVSQ